MRKFKSLIATVLIIGVAAAFAGCGNNDKSSQSSVDKSTTAADKDEETTAADDKGTEAGGENTGSYADSLDILKLIWDNYGENDKFACYGGSNLEDPVMDAPGSFDLSAKDALSATLLVPEALQGSIDNAASLVHMMNANSFTGAALHLKDKDVKEAADEMKDAIMNNQFMCGFPEKLVIITTGDYVVYAFGSEDIIDNFKKIAEEKVEGASVVCDQPME